MSSYFLKSGNCFRVTSKEALDLHESLPVGNYIVKKNDMTGELYLEAIDAFELPSKVYGSCLKDADRILNTFNTRKSTTGVLLTGEKGSGKTLLAKEVSSAGAKLGIPTIVINTPFCGAPFNSFIQSIEQPCVILFDEFEKVYDSEEQEKILTLLDGVFASRKLFMLTCNNKWKVDTHMYNRPGRIFYLLEFGGLDEQFIVEYCQDNLKDTSYINQLCQIAKIFETFNFDMLQAVVEEMNRYNENPQDALRMLNIKPDSYKDNENRQDYGLELFEDGRLVDPDAIDGGNRWYGNPLSIGGIDIEYKKWKDDSRTVDSEYAWTKIEFGPGDMVSFDSHTGKFTFKTKDHMIVLTKRTRNNNGFNFSKVF